MKRYRVPAVFFFSLLLVSSLVFLGCEVGSSDSVTRTTGVDFTGFYDSIDTNTAFVTPANSGSRVTSFNLRQNGDQLEAIDNNGIIFHGTVGDPSGTAGTGTAGFQLEGNTTVGQPVTISGTLNGANTADNNATAILDGTWIEAGLYARIHGDGTINPIPVPTPTTNTPTNVTAVVISPPGPVTLLANGNTQVFTASGGSGSFSSWTRGDPNMGLISSSSGPNTTYTRNANTGTNSLTVTDSQGAHATVTIIQP